VREALEAMLSRSSRLRARRVRARERPLDVRDVAGPSVERLLQIDDDYRRQAASGKLRRIAPRRFNPSGESWLPILHVDADGWFFTALFSNSARAHEAGKTRDWVVIYYERDGREGQATVVTETRGPLAGRRVVRGREQECARVLASA
jgi:hypothetical protein